MPNKDKGLDRAEPGKKDAVPGAGNVAPGPWRVSGFETSTGASGRVIMGSDGFSIAHVFERTPEENAANANVLAAAWDLLALLKDVVSPAISGFIHRRSMLPTVVSDRIFAAIAKVEGKSSAPSSPGTTAPSVQPKSKAPDAT